MFLVLLLSAATVARAATDPRELIRKRGDVANLIANPAVQRELKLTGVRKENAVEAAARLARQGASHERCDAELSKVLDPQQVRRLHEIRYRVLDALAVLDPEVSARLALTPVQKRKLDEARATGDREWDELSETIKRTRFRNPEQPRKLVESYLQRVNESLLTVLTEGQRARFQEMKGTPMPDLPGRP